MLLGNEVCFAFDFARCMLLVTEVRFTMRVHRRLHSSSVVLVCQRRLLLFLPDTCKFIMNDTMDAVASDTDMFVSMDSVPWIS